MQVCKIKKPGESVPDLFSSVNTDPLQPVSGHCEVSKLLRCVSSSSTELFCFAFLAFSCFISTPRILWFPTPVLWKECVFRNWKGMRPGRQQDSVVFFTLHLYSTFRQQGRKMILSLPSSTSDSTWNTAFHSGILRLEKWQERVKKERKEQ